MTFWLVTKSAVNLIIHRRGEPKYCSGDNGGSHSISDQHYVIVIETYIYVFLIYSFLNVYKSMIIRGP